MKLTNFELYEKGYITLKELEEMEDEENMRLREEIGHLKQMNASLKMDLESEEKDYRALYAYFEEAVREDSRIIKGLEAKVKDLKEHCHDNYALMLEKNQKLREAEAHVERLLYLKVTQRIADAKRDIEIIRTHPDRQTAINAIKNFEMIFMNQREEMFGGDE